MSKFLYTFFAGAILVGCQHSIVEPIEPIPLVDVRVEYPVEQAGKSAVLPDLHTVYLYPDFDYSVEPIVFEAQDNTAQIPLLPGNYKALIHSVPLDPLVLTGIESFETAMVSLPIDQTGMLASCPILYTLRAEDPMKAVNVLRVEEGDNLLVFQPILVTKRIRIEVNTSKFGNIKSVHGTLTGVASTLNLSTCKAQLGQTLPLNNVSIDGNKLIIEAFDVLGFTAEKLDDVVLTLYVRNDEVDFDLEQPIDLTEEIKQLKEEGGDVHIKIDLTFNPDIRVHPVTIQQWDESGNEIEIGFK